MVVGSRNVLNHHAPRGRLQLRGDDRYTPDFADSGLSLKDWKRKMSENPLICSVSDPVEQKKKTFFKMGRKQGKLYTLRVSSKSGTRQTQRSLKDFGALREALRTRFEGCVVPPLPATQRLPKQSGSNTTRVAHALEHFLQALADHPFFRNESCFQDFITSGKAFDHKALSRPSPVPSEGIVRWNEALKSRPFVADPLDLVKKLSEELTHMKRAVKLVSQACEKHLEKLQGFASATVLLSQGFSGWADVEAQRVREFSGEAFTPTSRAPNGQITVRDQLTDVATMNSQYAAVLHEEYGPDQLEDLLVDSIRFELSVLGEWEDALAITQNKIRALRKLQMVVANKEEELNRLVSGAAGGGKDPATQIRKIKSQLEDHQAALRISEEETGQYQRACLGLEIQLFRESRAIRVEKITRAYQSFHLRGIEAIKKCFDGTGVGYSLEDSTRVRTKGRLARKLNKARYRTGDGDTSSLTGSLYQVAEDVGTLADFDVTQLGAGAVEDHATLKVVQRYRAKKNDELDIDVDQMLSAVRIDDSLWFATTEGGSSGIVHAANVKVAPKSPLTDSAFRSRRPSKTFPTISSMPPPPANGERKLSGLFPPGLGRDRIGSTTAPPGNLGLPADVQGQQSSPPGAFRLPEIQPGSPPRPRGASKGLVLPAAAPKPGDDVSTEATETAAEAGATASREADVSTAEQSGGRFGGLFARRPSKGAPSKPKASVPKPSEPPKNVPSAAAKPNGLLGAIQGFDKNALKSAENTKERPPVSGSAARPMNPMEELMRNMKARGVVQDNGDSE